jgi:hypothetical protein
MAATQSTEARDALIELKKISDRFKQEISNLKLTLPVRQKRFIEPSHLAEVEGCPPVCSSSTAYFKSNQKSQRKIGEKVMRFHLPGCHGVVDYTPVAYVIWYSLVLLVAQLAYRNRKCSRTCTVYTRILSDQLQIIGRESKPQ